MNKDFKQNYTTNLVSLSDTDQQAIKDYKAGKILAPELARINKKNVEIVKHIISKIGFPTIKSTSKNAYKAAVIVVLHSGDIQLLTQSINALQNADETLIDKRDIAYMIDKVRIAQNLPQLYGTQYKISKDFDIKYIDIDNPDELEKRRAEFGMERFDEYKKKVEQSIVDVRKSAN